MGKEITAQLQNSHQASTLTKHSTTKCKPITVFYLCWGPAGVCLTRPLSWIGALSSRCTLQTLGQTKKIGRGTGKFFIEPKKRKQSLRLLIPSCDQYQKQTAITNRIRKSEIIYGARGVVAAKKIKSMSALCYWGYQRLFEGLVQHLAKSFNCHNNPDSRFFKTFNYLFKQTLSLYEITAEQQIFSED